ncbi:MAG: 3'-5' exonuclease, partial [Myxococcales bacterium]|nr:3'-5' exonuclease [Myxococcales bacterium]
MRLLPKFLKNLIPDRPLSAAASAWPRALRDYMASKSRLSKGTPLSDVRFVVFDSETSGLDLAKNRLLSIAGVAMSGPEVQLDDAFEAMVAQRDVGGASAAVIHGLVPNDLSDGLPEDEAAARFLAYAGDAVLVAHHAAFDVQMLRKAIASHRGAKVWNPIIDTAQFAERVEAGPMSSG